MAASKDSKLLSPNVSTSTNYNLSGDPLSSKNLEYKPPPPPFQRQSLAMG